MVFEQCCMKATSASSGTRCFSGSGDGRVPRGQTWKVDDGTGVIRETVHREAVLGKPALQCLIGVEAATGIEKEFRRSPEDEPDAFGGTLQDVVENAEDLLVVLLAGLGALQLVEIDQFVEADDHSAEPGHTDELRQQPQAVVE